MHTRFRFRVASALGAVDLANVLACARDSVARTTRGIVVNSFGWSRRPDAWRIVFFTYG